MPSQHPYLSSLENLFKLIFNIFCWHKLIYGNQLRGEKKLSYWNHFLDLMASIEDRETRTFTRRDENKNQM